MLYRIEIMERLIKTIEVEANDENQALQKVREEYKSEEIVLNSDDFFDVDFYIVSK